MVGYKECNRNLNGIGCDISVLLSDTNDKRMR